MYIYINMCVAYISNISIVTVIVAYNYIGLHHWNSLDVINQFNTIHFPSEARFCQASQSKPSMESLLSQFRSEDPPRISTLNLAFLASKWEEKTLENHQNGNLMVICSGDLMDYWLVVWNIFIFHNIWDNPSHWLIFFKMVKTTNQINNGLILVNCSVQWGISWDSLW